MSNTSARLGLPYLMPPQAQKHVTPTSPVTPGDGVGVTPVGAWAGEAEKLAYWNGEAWLFFGAQEGWQAWGNDTGQLRVLQGSVWEATASVFENLPGLGVNATSDATNRLSVAAQATLLSHDGAGHQLKLNKASLLYQSGFNGHAEMGLTGDNDFHIKVSPDSATWTEALVVDSATELVSGAAVQVSATDITACLRGL